MRVESEREEGPGPAGGWSGSCRKGEGHADGGTGIGILAGRRTLQKRLAHAGPASTRGGRRNRQHSSDVSVLENIASG